MNALAKFAYHEMEARRLARLKCKKCKHVLGRHSSLGHCGGDLGGKLCRCSEFVEPESQLALR